MKNLLFLLAFTLIGLVSCEVENMSNPNDAYIDPVCQEIPPTDEICQAVFTRWFYDANTNTCEEIAYSGCNLWGFETQSDCEGAACGTSKN